MPCTPVPIPAGVAIVCTRGTRQRCHRCGQPATALCDHVEPGRRRRCSQPLCDRCAMHVGPELHHCPHHPRQASPEQLGLFEASRQP